MDIGAWLRSLRLQQYEQAFHDNGIDGEVLPKLTAGDLKEIGVTAVGHRRKLLAAIARLNSGEGTATAGSQLRRSRPGRSRRPRSPSAGS